MWSQYYDLALVKIWNSISLILQPLRPLWHLTSGHEWLDIIIILWGFASFLAIMFLFYEKYNTKLHAIYTVISCLTMQWTARNIAGPLESFKTWGEGGRINVVGIFCPGWVSKIGTLRFWGSKYYWHPRVRGPGPEQTAPADPNS